MITMSAYTLGFFFPKQVKSGVVADKPSDRDTAVRMPPSGPEDRAPAERIDLPEFFHLYRHF
jgi:hypothetical protein